MRSTFSSDTLRLECLPALDNKLPVSLSCLSHFIIETMAPKDPTQLEDSNSHLTCCNKSVKQFGEIKNELKNIRQAVSFTAVLLSKLAGVTPEEIKALIKSSAFHDFTSSPVVDFLSIINIVSSDALVTDPCEHKSSPSEEYIDTDDVFSNLEVTFTNENKTNSVDGKTDNAESGDVSGKISEVAALNRISETLANETLVEAEDIKSPYRVENEALTNAYLHAFTPLLQDCSLSIITSDRPPLPALGNSVKTDSASVSEDPKAVRSNTKEAVPINLCSGRPSQSELSVSTTSVTTSVDSVSSGFVTQPLSVLPDGDFPSSSAIPHSTDRDLDNREIVEIKQEQVTEYEDENVSAAPVESRFTDFVDNVKMETEAVYISDKTMPMCLLMKSEEEFCTAEQNVASTSYATTGFAQEISSKRVTNMSAAERMRKSREKRKADPVKWEEYLRKERERNKLRRIKMKEEFNKNIKNLRYKRLKDAERKRKSRLRKK
ncbi:hypothetical protein ANN_07404 [Periplaneta americana]|uniref:Uncharacterized protein n=1 Tax=Periplaneta americana TaxID=6978 RepID=A0ABQ8SZ73_PERAM|nr:hypothetical protein ANN_07404 [Periplaneta americana]